MKRTLLFMTCMLASLTMLAQEYEYIPFVKAGKRWNVISSKFGGNNHYEYYMLMDEKVEKAGMTYMKMYRSEDDLTVVYDAGLLREENRKVYFFDSDMQKEFLLFDYSLKSGDTYETFSYDEQKAVTYKVLSVNDCTEGPTIVHRSYDEKADSTVTQRRYLRKWTICSTDDNSLQKTWIEGVGSLEGPLANLYDARPVSTMDYLAYADNTYLPFPFHNKISHVHGCNLRTTSIINLFTSWKATACMSTERCSPNVVPTITPTFTRVKLMTHWSTRLNSSYKKWSR